MFVLRFLHPINNLFIIISTKITIVECLHEKISNKSVYIFVLVIILKLPCLTRALIEKDDKIIRSGFAKNL